MPVDISPLMDSPWWKSVKTPAQRKELLEVFQDPNTSADERGAILQMAQQPLPAEPSAAAPVVSSVGGMLKAMPGMAMGAVGLLGRAAERQQPWLLPPTFEGRPPQTSQEQEAALLPAEQAIEKGANAIPGLMAGPAWGKAGYKAGETILSKLAPYVANRPLAQTAANALPATFEAGGNYLSRQANVAMGTEQPGMGGDIASAAIPAAWRTISSAPVARRLPGSAVTQHEMAAEDVQALSTRMQPKAPSETLYEQVYKGTNPTINSGNLRQMAEGIIKTEMEHGPSTRSGTLLGLAKDLKALSAKHADEIPMDRLYREMKRYGEKIGEAGVAQTAGTKGISKLYAGFHEALEDAANSNIPESETLRQAIKASRQEHAVERLERITGQGRGITSQQGTGYTLVSGKRMLNEFDRLLADDDVFRGSFTADELADMRKVFEGSVKLPALPPPPSAQRGAGKAALAGSIGGGIGYAVSGPEGAKIGTMAGIAAPEVISRLMTTTAGRAMLKAAFEGRDTITPEVLAVLNQAARQIPATYTSKRPTTD